MENNWIIETLRFKIMLNENRCQQFNIDRSMWRYKEYMDMRFHVTESDIYVISFLKDGNIMGHIDCRYEEENDCWSGEFNKVTIIYQHTKSLTIEVKM